MEGEQLQIASFVLTNAPTSMIYNWLDLKARLRTISKNIGTDWSKLADALDPAKDHGTIDSQELQYYMAKAFLDKWYQQNRNTDSVSQLKTALQQIGRTDIADIIGETCAPI